MARMITWEQLDQEKRDQFAWFVEKGMPPLEAVQFLPYHEQEEARAKYEAEARESGLTADVAALPLSVVDEQLNGCYGTSFGDPMRRLTVESMSARELAEDHERRRA